MVLTEFGSQSLGFLLATSTAVWELEVAYDVSHGRPAAPVIAAAAAALLTGATSMLLGVVWAWLRHRRRPPRLTP